MRWLTRQLSECAPNHFRFTEPFGFVHLPRDPIHADVLASRVGEGRFELKACGRVRMLFHTHAWCSTAHISVGSVERVENLYSTDHGYCHVEFDLPAAETTTIVVRPGPPVDGDAKGMEVWLAAIEFDAIQPWQPRSMPITEHCSFTRGQHGGYLTLTADTTIGASIVNTGVWAPRDVEFFRTVLRPGMTALDVGANIGHHTVLFSSLVGAQGRVVAFEPQSVIFRLLAGNAAINGCENADVVQSCVGQAEGTVHLYPIDYSGAANFGALGVDTAPVSHEGKQGELCRVATLDQLLSELRRPLMRCDFIKIDVQSFELFVLKGGEQTLARYCPTLFLEISPFWMSKSYDYREVYEFLWRHGYEISHPTDPAVPAGSIKAWSGRETEEWDIIATPRRNAGL